MKKLILWLSTWLRNLVEPEVYVPVANVTTGYKGERSATVPEQSDYKPKRKCKACRTILPEKPCTAKITEKVSFIYYRCRKCGKYTKFKI